MNNKFEWKRFCLVVRKDWRNMWPTFGTTMLILASLPFAIWMLTLVINSSDVIIPEVRVFMINAMAAVAALMAPSRIYRTMNLRSEGIYFAMLPASRQEKFFSMLLFTIVVSPLLVLIGGIALDMILTVIPWGPYHTWVWKSSIGFPFICEVGISEINTAWYILTSFSGFIGSVALFIFTATLFRKHKVIFTILCVYLINFILSIVAIPIAMAITRSPDSVELIYDTINSWDSKQLANIVWGTISTLNIAFSALMLCLSWRRLSRMPY